MKKLKLLSFLLIACLAISCSNERNKFVGTWTRGTAHNGNDMLVTIRSEGSSFIVKHGDKEKVMTYDEKEKKLSGESNSWSNHSYLYSAENDQLLETNDNGEIVATLERVK